MGKIATRAFCNTLKPGAFSSELTHCPTKSEIEAVKLAAVGNYSSNQLVIEGDIKVMIGIIMVGQSGAIYKKPY